MSPRATLGIGALCLLLGLHALLPPAARAEPESPEASPGETIAWAESLPIAFERAAAEQKIVMICINARSAYGEPDEPAAKGLREVVYRDPAVVERSRAFVCVLLTAEGTSEDYGELRERLGIDGNIVSPQHIFARPDQKHGMSPLVRQEYWPHGSGERAVQALLRLMDQALETYREQERKAAEPLDPGQAALEGGAPPEDAAARARWVEALLTLVRDRDAALRRRALQVLATHDREGDCLLPLVPLIGELEEAGRSGPLVDLVRALGAPGLEAATPALHDLLKHKDIHVRANAAVTLEFIGSAASTEPLLTCVKREKNASVANHMYRALGRCGAADTAAKRTLLRSARPGKEGDFGCFGPVIGLAYLEGDAKLARALERELLKLGLPSLDGERTHTFLRVLLLWCLGEIRDPKTAPFLTQRVIEPLAKEAGAEDDLVRCCEAVVRKCEGADDAQRDIDAGVWANIGWDNARALADKARRGRDTSRFTPKGEFKSVSEDDED